MRNTIVSLLFALSISAMIWSCQDPAAHEQANYYSNGMRIYKASCQTCHGEKGEGLGSLTPPLTDTVFMKQNKELLSCIIKNGMDSTIVVNGKEYSEKMKGFPEMTDFDIAQVIVYITNSFGNNQGMYNYNRVAIDLQNCK
ncbi:MAG: cytochrome c [Pedobacter sp.]|nr:MAG: cytochrome c [Pedobacter sp.]